MFKGDGEDSTNATESGSLTAIIYMNPDLTVQG
jgi:hypothetical protein